MLKANLTIQYSFICFNRPPIVIWCDYFATTLPFSWLHHIYVYMFGHICVQLGSLKHSVRVSMWDWVYKLVKSAENTQKIWHKVQSSLEEQRTQHSPLPGRPYITEFCHSGRFYSISNINLFVTHESLQLNLLFQGLIGEPHPQNLTDIFPLEAKFSVDVGPFSIWDPNVHSIHCTIPDCA